MIPEKKIHYWIHPESSCLFTTESNKHPGDLCESVTKEKYEELLKENEEAKERMTIKTDDS